MANTICRPSNTGNVGLKEVCKQWTNIIHHRTLRSQIWTVLDHRLQTICLSKSFHHFFFSKLKRLNNGVPWMSSTSWQLNFLFTIQPNFIFLLQIPFYNLLHSFPLIFQSTKHRSNVFFKFLDRRRNIQSDHQCDSKWSISGPSSANKSRVQNNLLINTYKAW